MNSIIKYITLGAIMVFCQILVSEYVNIWAVLYIAVFPQFIILLPPTINRSAYMLIAFVLGLSIDILADGVMGLNAAALTAMAYSRGPILKLIIPKASFENYENHPIIPRTVEPYKLALLSGMMLAVFFTVFPFTVIDITVGICIFSSAVFSVIFPFTFIDISVGICHFSSAVSLVIFIFTFIHIALR